MDAPDDKGKVINKLDPSPNASFSIQIEKLIEALTQKCVLDAEREIIIACSHKKLPKIITTLHDLCEKEEYTTHLYPPVCVRPVEANVQILTADNQYPNSGEPAVGSEEFLKAVQEQEDEIYEIMHKQSTPKCIEFNKSIVWGHNGPLISVAILNGALQYSNYNMNNNTIRVKPIKTMAKSSQNQQESGNLSRSNKSNQEPKSYDKVISYVTNKHQCKAASPCKGQTDIKNKKEPIIFRFSKNLTNPPPNNK